MPQRAELIDHALRLRAPGGRVGQADHIHFIQTCPQRYGAEFTIRIPRIGVLVFLTNPDGVRTMTRGIQRFSMPARPLRR